MMKLETIPVKKWWWEVYKPADLFEWSVYLFTGLLFKKIIVRYRYFVDGKEVKGPYVQKGKQ